MPSVGDLGFSLDFNIACVVKEEEKTARALARLELRLLYDFG